MRSCLGCVVVASLVVALLVAPSASRALPGDPPIEPVAPAEGATVAPSSAGYVVTFRCPNYRQDSSTSGGPEDYRVRFSSRGTVDANGELDVVARLVSVTPGSDGTCTARSEPGLTPGDGGRVWWQAVRYCGGCVFTSGITWELGPVRTFVVDLTAGARLTVPKRLFVGYLGVFGIRTDTDITGLTARLDRQAGKRWRSLATETASGRTAELLASLPSGRHRIRATLVTPGGSKAVIATRTVTVRKDAQRTTSLRDDGAYRARKGPGRTLELRVGGGGRTLRDVRVPISLYCPTVDQAARQVPTVVRLTSVRIAPDGRAVREQRFTGERGRGTVRLVARLQRQRVTGMVTASLPGCSGTTRIELFKRR